MAVLGAAGVNSAISRVDSSPYFPERGYAAIFQRSLDLQNPVVILSIALEPGLEDLPTLAYLRLGRGARIVSLYVTNGEATPSDLCGEPPFLLAARRKEEAYQAISYLGGETHFLNLPDLGVVSSRDELTRAWNPDTVLTRLVGALRSYRPDVILLARDFRGAKGEIIRQSTFQEMLLQAVRTAAEQSARKSSSAVWSGRGRSEWKVQRIFVDKGIPNQAVEVNSDSLHPIWKKSYREIAAEAAEYYQSLRVQRKSWYENGRRSYTSIYPPSETPGLRPRGALVEKTSDSFDRGLRLHTPRLQGLANTIARIARQAIAGKSVTILSALSAAVDSVDGLLGPKTMVASLDRKTLLTWKNRLESLRCALLDIDIKFTVSESLVTRSQLFFLKFHKFSGKITRGETLVVFPGVRTAKWVVNEAFSHELPFELQKDYRILTPRDFEYNAPGAVYGLDRPTVRAYFTFVVVHRDSLRERSFQYRRDIPLRVGPRFSAEILTPVVYTSPGELLVYRFQNFTRDGVYGDVFVEDSAGRSDQNHFRLSTKDSWIQDTLGLHWRPNLPTADHVLDLKISGITVGRFVARKFDVLADTARQVGLITGLEGSPLSEALRRLRIPVVPLDSSHLQDQGLPPLRTILIDRDAPALRPELPASLSHLLSWVGGGGHLIIFPTLSSDSATAAKFGFQLWPALSPTSELISDTSHPILLHPNKIHGSDWDGWIFARAWGVVSQTGIEAGEVVVRSKSSGAPLLVTKKHESGRITYVALDLSSQLMNIHPGAFRLLANLLSSDYID